MSAVDANADQDMAGCTPMSRALTFEQAIVWARRQPEFAGLMELCYFNDPIEREATRFRDSEEWAAIAALLPPAPSRRVLEIGAGRGLLSWAFASAGCDVHALEPDPSPIVGSGAIRQLCAATGTHVNICETAGESLPFPDNFFSYVVCRAVLHHVSDLQAVCREVHRVLAPNGRFLAIKEHTAESEAELQQFLRVHPTHRYVGNEHAYPVRTYEACIADAGLTLLRSWGHYDHVLSCSPHVTTEHIKAMLTGALSTRSVPAAIARAVASSPAIIHLYRRHLTRKCRIPGQHATFLAQKGPSSIWERLFVG